MVSDVDRDVFELKFKACIDKVFLKQDANSTESANFCNDSRSYAPKAAHSIEMSGCRRSTGENDKVASEQRLQNADAHSRCTNKSLLHPKESALNKTSMTKLNYVIEDDRGFDKYIPKDTDDDEVTFSNFKGSVMDYTKY